MHTPRSHQTVFRLPVGGVAYGRHPLEQENRTGKKKERQLILLIGIFQPLLLVLFCSVSYITIQYTKTVTPLPLQPLQSIPTTSPSPSPSTLPPPHPPTHTPFGSVQFSDI